MVNGLLGIRVNLGNLNLPADFVTIRLSMSSGKLDKKQLKLNKNAEKIEKQGKLKLTKQGKRDTICTKVRNFRKAGFRGVIFWENAFECFA